MLITSLFLFKKIMLINIYIEWFEIEWCKNIKLKKKYFLIRRHKKQLKIIFFCVTCYLNISNTILYKFRQLNQHFLFWYSRCQMNTSIFFLLIRNRITQHKNIHIFPHPLISIFFCKLSNFDSYLYQYFNISFFNNFFIKLIYTAILGGDTLKDSKRRTEVYFHILSNSTNWNFFSPNTYINKFLK